MTAASVLDVIVATVSVVTAISVSTERIVEMIKRIIPAIETMQGPFKKALIHIMSVGIGTTIALTGMEDIQKLVPYIDSYYECVFLGLMASGGSSLWHDVLGIVLEVKQSKTALTKTT